MPKTPSEPRSNVFSLAQAREERRIPRYRELVQQMLRTNRAALDRLHCNGKLYSRDGATLGRRLLLAHEQLLRAATLLEHLADEGVVPAPRNTDEITSLYAEVDALMGQTEALRQKSGHALALLQNE